MLATRATKLSAEAHHPPPPRPVGEGRHRVPVAANSFAGCGLHTEPSHARHETVRRGTPLAPTSTRRRRPTSRPRCREFIRRVWGAHRTQPRAPRNHPPRHPTPPHLDPSAKADIASPLPRIHSPGVGRTPNPATRAGKPSAEARRPPPPRPVGEGRHRVPVAANSFAGTGGCASARRTATEVARRRHPLPRSSWERVGELREPG
jgi:hypothetical protein